MKAATAAVGLLAGVVAGVYVLGGLVIALRMIFDDFALNSVVVILGQLPRELVITTAMLDVLLPAATFGLIVGLVTAFVVGWRRSSTTPEPKSRASIGAILILFAVTFLLVLPAIVSVLQTDGLSPWLLTALVGVATTFFAAYAGWYLICVVGKGELPVGGKLAIVGGICAVVAVTPAVMFAASLSFESAQVCTAGSQAPVRGLLIGEGGGRLLLEEHFSKEAGVISLPADKITKSEYGDLSSTFTCPPPPGAKVAARQAEARLGPHGGEVERKLAISLRPRLRFDSREPWRPLEVGAFLQERFGRKGSHGACPAGADPPCPPVKGLGELRRRAGAPAYIDIHGKGTEPEDFKSPYPACRPADTEVVDCNGGPLSAIYYRRTSHERRWYWDYWWFFRYNDYNGHHNECDVYCDDHEGDWEGMTVITTPSRRPVVLGAIYAAHRDRVRVDASILPLAGSHPLAFVADGTHATYPFSCDGKKQCRQYLDFLGVNLPEGSHDGAVAWGGNLDAECVAARCVRPLPEIGHPRDLAAPLAGAWAGWPGHWGETCHRGCKLDGASPQSPGSQIRFECPWAANRWARPAADGSGASDSVRAGDAERLLAVCRAQRGGR